MSLSANLPESHYRFFSRRKALMLGLTGITTTLTGISLSSLLSPSPALAKVPPTSQKSDPSLPFDPIALLRDFDYGTIKRENGRNIREFEVVATTTPIQLNAGVSFVSWNLNGRVPGPTLRATEGDRIRVIFRNEGGHSHSIHFHGIHPAEMDGVKPVRQGKTAIYEFDVGPYGLYPYHCHVAPITRHVSKGLYGVLIVDPRQKRQSADEMVMIMGGYDLNNQQVNDLYAFNGIPEYYHDHPIPIYQNQLIRLYVLNMVEYDPAVTFHIHGNLFKVYRGGRTLTPDEETDVITMGTAERHILEFSYPYPGRYMFHPHQDAIAEKGCMGLFEVLPS